MQRGGIDHAQLRKSQKVPLTSFVALLEFLFKNLMNLWLFLKKPIQITKGGGCQEGKVIGAGGKFKLSLQERVFMTLFFLRHYLTFALLGFLFELHESNAYIWRKVSWEGEGIH